jgi:hypothetical protein
MMFLLAVFSISPELSLTPTPAPSPLPMLGEGKGVGEEVRAKYYEFTERTS